MPPMECIREDDYMSSNSIRNNHCFAQPRMSIGTMMNEFARRTMNFTIMGSSYGCHIYARERKSAL